jgi:hypothetical protein
MPIPFKIVYNLLHFHHKIVTVMDIYLNCQVTTKENLTVTYRERQSILQMA